MLFRKFLPLSLVAILAVGVSACSGVIHKRVFIDNGKGLSLGARQRTILVTQYGGKDRDRQIVCAEPSPDVFSVRAASASAALNGVFGGTGGGTSSRAAGAAFATSESAATITRTQTVQLLRDGLYRLCEAYMNGAVDEAQYNVALANMDKLMTNLLAIDTIGGTAMAQAVGITATSDSNFNANANQVDENGNPVPNSVGGGANASGSVVGVGGVSPAAIAELRDAADVNKNNQLDAGEREAFEKYLAALPGGGSTTINKPLDEESARQITKIALAHRRLGDKVAAFGAICFGVMNRDPDQPLLTHSQVQLRERCNEYLKKLQSPSFLLALKDQKASPYFEPYYEGK